MGNAQLPACCSARQKKSKFPTAQLPKKPLSPLEVPTMIRSQKPSAFQRLGVPATYGLAAWDPEAYRFAPEPQYVEQTLDGKRDKPAKLLNKILNSGKPPEPSPYYIAATNEKKSTRQKKRKKKKKPSLWDTFSGDKDGEQDAQKDDAAEEEDDDDGTPEIDVDNNDSTSESDEEAKKEEEFKMDMKLYKETLKDIPDHPVPPRLIEQEMSRKQQLIQRLIYRIEPLIQARAKRTFVEPSIYLENLSRIYNNVRGGCPVLTKSRCVYWVGECTEENGHPQVMIVLPNAGKQKVYVTRLIAMYFANASALVNNGGLTVGPLKNVCKNHLCVCLRHLAKHQDEYTNK